MTKFSNLKKKIFLLFEKQDKKNRKSDSLSQPDGSNGNYANVDDKNLNKSKLIKKILIWVISLGLLAAIIAPIVVSCTRRTEISISNNLTAIYDSGSSTLTFTDKDNNKKYSIAANDPSSYLSAYFRATSNQIQVKLKTKDSSLPIVVNATITGDTLNNKQVFFGQDSNDIYSYSDSNNSIAKYVVGLWGSATTMPASFNWLGLITSLLPSLLLIAIFIAYFSMMKKGMGSGQESIFSIGKSGIKPAKTNVRFTDVAGIDEVKEELKELVDYIKNPNKYSAMGARAPKGVILYGPPGTGKTLIAKAVAGEANCNFFATSGSSFEDMLVGVGAKRVRDLFSKARKLAPTIVFIDEIDSVASKRGKNDVIGGGSGVADQTINQLLAEMDGFTTDSGVIVIAATNRIDVLDDAILRPGRFDRQIQVTLPDIKGREQILKIHAKNKNLSSEVNLMDIARRTPGFSGAQLENVLNEAAILAVRQNKVVIKTNDIDEAIDRVIGGPARHGRVITEEEKRQIASHEAGHALVGLHTKNTEIVQKITIIPRGDAAGYTLQTPQEQERTIQTKEELLNQVRMTLGGRAAEEVIYGESQISTGAANDLYKVSKIVKAMVLSLGMSKLGLTQFVPSEGNVSPLQPKMFSETTARELDLEIEEIIQKEYKKAKEIIIKNRKELDLIVETLMTLETIMKNQIDYIHENLKLPKEVIEFKNKSNNKNNEDNEKDQDDKSDNKKKKD